MNNCFKLEGVPRTIMKIAAKISCKSPEVIQLVSQLPEEDRRIIEALADKYTKQFAAEVEQIALSRFNKEASNGQIL